MKDVQESTENVSVFMDSWVTGTIWFMAAVPGNQSTLQNSGQSEHGIVVTASCALVSHRHALPETPRKPAGSQMQDQTCGKCFFMQI